MEAPPSPLSSRPERSVVERSAESADLSWECFSTERSAVEGPEVQRISHENIFFDKAYVYDAIPRPTMLAAAMMTSMPPQSSRTGLEPTPAHSPSARPTIPPKRT